MSISKNLAECRVLVAYPVALSEINKPFISEDIFFLTTVPEADPRVISFPFGSSIDMEVLMASLPNGWYPDIFIAYVNSFFYLVPVNVSALRCPKILLLGDTHHGSEPLQKIIKYVQQEQYDYHIVNFDRHHIWYYWLAGIKNLYWLPTLLVTSPIVDFQQSPFQQSPLQQETIPNQSFQNKAIFIGNFNCHPRRWRTVEYLSHHVADFSYGQVQLQDSFKVFNQANISLNVSLNGDVNMRNFEIISAGGFLLSERLSDEAGMHLLLEEGRDYEAFSDLDELLDKIRYFLVNSSLKYRQSSYQKYLDLLSPDKSMLRLQELLQGKSIADIFTSQSIKRIQYLGYQKLSVARLQLYELIQNIHRVWDKLVIAIDTQVEFAYATDFLDLNRVEIIINQDHLDENTIEYLTASNNLSRVRMTQEYLEEEFNVIITSACEPIILQKLSQRNTLIISNDYQGLAVACAYQDFAGWQWDQGATSNDFFIINGNVDDSQLALIDFISWHELPIISDTSLFINSLDLRDVNLLIYLDWHQPENLICDRLLSALTPVFTSPQADQIALVVCIAQDQEEMASLLLSSVMMNILMQENIQVMGEPGIVFVDRSNSLLWSEVLPQIQSRISLEFDRGEFNQEKTDREELDREELHQEEPLEITNLPLWIPEQLG